MSSDPTTPDPPSAPAHHGAARHPAHPAVYAKALATFASTLAVAITATLADGTMDGAAWWRAISGALGAAAVVWGIPNADARTKGSTPPAADAAGQVGW